ncbi:C-Myc-binding protein isoform X2 [Panthera pardus]|uniref:c-Myc-binding protein isoform X2 n=2 Tax=Felidae TaxID=9681 RepID=A0ABM3P7X4_ACIJB|nr:C-Myc-binding protein isoform X2 [Felis catus]XP_042852610.1 C-Myc-binding protein isoform X2 [Panthera tigris]XP_053067782.1 C-Myc-binding protein isoform X2 [Acinonyx jubatus]XP_053753245.1 C-Myc-binding protein isoform X2 [Panthera pardus]
MGVRAQVLGACGSEAEAGLPDSQRLLPALAPGLRLLTRRVSSGRRLEAGAVPEVLGEVGGAGHADQGFLKHHLGAATPENPEIELLRLELAEMKEKYEAIVEENKKLKTKLAQYEPPQEEKRAE